MKYELDRDILIKYIQSGLSVDEIVKLTNIHRSKILYSLSYNTLDDEYSEIFDDYILNNIIVKKYKDNAKFIIIADVHMCSKKQRIDLLYKVYNFAASNNINEIYVAGDFIHGVLTESIKECRTYESHINYFINNYPYDKNIISNLLFGNHEYLLEYHSGYDICNLFEEARDDFNVLSYKRSYVNVCDNIIQFKHENSKNKLYVPSIVPDIQFRGHQHFFKYINDYHDYFKKDVHKFYVPHLSYRNDKYLTNENEPGFYLFEASNKNNYNEFSTSLYNVDRYGAYEMGTKELILKKSEYFNRY